MSTRVLGRRTAAIAPFFVSLTASRVVLWVNVCQRWRAARVLVLDEISMLPAELFDMLERPGPSDPQY